MRAWKRATTIAWRALTCWRTIRTPTAPTAFTTSRARWRRSRITSEVSEPQRPLGERSPPPFRHGREQLQDGSGRRVAAVRILHRRRELVAQLLAELHAPLVEGVDAPHDALREHAVLIERDEPAEGCGIELLEQHDGAR